MKVLVKFFFIIIGDSCFEFLIIYFIIVGVLGLVGFVFFLVLLF